MKKQRREEEVIATQERRSLRLFCALAVPALLVLLLIFWALRVTGAAWTDADGEEEAIVYTAWDEALSVTVSAPADALPGDASLSVTVLDEDTSDFADALSVMKAWESEMPDEEDLLSAKEAVSLSSVSAAAAAEMTEEEAAEKEEEDEEDNTLTLSWAEAADCGTAVLDISFFTKEGEVEPAQPVTVSLKLTDLLPEDADLSTVRIIHLQKTAEGTVAETVADADGTSGGTFDQKTLTAVFTVDAFSKFAVQWETNDSSFTIDVKVFDMDGLGFQEDLDTDYAHENDLLTISDLVEHLHDNSGSASAHHFEYAQVAYETASTQGGGYTIKILGEAANSVTSLSYSGGSGKSVYTVGYENETTGTVEDPELIEIYLFYSIPEVSIDVDLSGQVHPDTQLGSGVVQLVTTNNYFKGLEATDSQVTYTWLMSDSSMGEFSNQIDEGDYAGSIVFTFNGIYEERGSVQSGDQVTVSVTMTNTYTDENGETVTESATAAFTLTYKTTSLTVTVYQSDGKTVQPGALVAAVNQQTGETVATGTTDENGEVSLMLPDGDYIIGVTYLEQTSGQGPVGVARYTGESEVSISFDADGNASQSGSVSVTLDSGVSTTNGSINETGEWDYTTPYYYEHIDVKVSVAESADQSYAESFSSLDKVLVYDKYGNLLYTCQGSGLVANSDTDDYNCLFDFGDVTEQHSIVVSSEDTIVISYEVEVFYYELDENGNRVLAADDPTWTGLTDENGYKVTGTEFRTYTITLPADGTYPEGEYYHYDDINASQLYQILFGNDWSNGTTYSSLEEQNAAFIEAVEKAKEEGTLSDKFQGLVVDENGTILGIDLSSLNYLQVADYLCDTRTRSGQAGLDFAVDTQITPEYWEFKILKSYEGYPSENGELPTDVFNFELYEVSVSETVDDEWTWIILSDQEPIATTEVGGTDQEGESNWSSDSSGGYTSTGVMRTAPYETNARKVYYYIVKEVPTTYTTVDIPAYGIVVWLGEAAGTSGNNNGKIENVSYCRLTETLNEETGETVYASDGKLYTLKTINVYGEDKNGDTVIADTYYALPFVNTYNTLDIYKYTLGSETAGTVGSSLRALQTSDEEEEGAEGLYVKAGSYYVFVNSNSSITPLYEGDVTADTLVSNLYTVKVGEPGSEDKALLWTAGKDGWYYFTGLDGSTALLFMEESEYDAYKDSWVAGDMLPQYTTTSFVHYVIADGLPEAVFTLQAASDEDFSLGSGMYAYFTKSSNGSFILKGWYDAASLDDKTELSNELLSNGGDYPDGATFFLQSAEDGFVSVKGLESGDFVLQETESPQGYMVLDKTIAFSIEEDGTLLGGQSAAGIGVLDGSVNVYNPSESYILPNTGGIGTKKLYALALTLVMTAAAGLLLSCRRRLKA